MTDCLWPVRDIRSGLAVADGAEWVSHHATVVGGSAKASHHRHDPERIRKGESTR